MDGCTALVVSAIFDRGTVAKALIAACRKRGIGVDHQTVRGEFMRIRTDDYSRNRCENKEERLVF